MNTPTRDITPEEVVEQVRHLTVRLAGLEDEVSALRANTNAKIPPGWALSNYTCVARPELSICRDSVSGLWVVWDGRGGKLGEDADLGRLAARFVSGGP